jgi:hypothetical protein
MDMRICTFAFFFWPFAKEMTKNQSLSNLKCQKEEETPLEFGQKKREEEPIVKSVKVNHIKV